MRLFAQPYNPDANGFYFESLEEFNEKMKNCRDSFGSPIEEFEIQFIDGTDQESDLAKAVRLDQTNLEDFFDLTELDNDDQAKVFYLIDQCNYSVKDVWENYEDVMLYSGDLEEAGQELFDELYLSEIPEHLRSYIDYQQFSKDCELSGDMSEFEFAGETYTCTNANAN